MSLVSFSCWLILVLLMVNRAELRCSPCQSDPYQAVSVPTFDEKDDDLFFLELRASRGDNRPEG